MTAHAPYLRILREPATLDTPARMSPAEIALTLSVDVLRLPYPPATRLVLAEIVSLHAANAGCCDASDTHFADRLTISRDTASRAVQQLEADGLVIKDTQRRPTGFYRTLVPVPAAIKAKAQTNPYPQNAARYPQNAASRKMPVGYPQNAASPSRILPLALAANSGSNTPLNLPVNLQEDSTPPTPAADAAAAGPEKKIEQVLASLPTEPTAPTIAPRCEAPPKPAKAKPATAGEPAEFGAFWAAWPKKEGRLDAARAFAKLSADDQAAAASRADTWLAGRPDLLDPARYRFILHASTWLNQQRWTDEAPATPSTAFNPASHATSSTGAPHLPRPANGAKPSANAGKLSRALFGRLAE